MEVAGTADVRTAPGAAVVYSISYQPTRANKEAAEAYMAKHPEAMTIDCTLCGRKLADFGLAAYAENEADREKIADIWRLASRRFIESAAGNITAFVDNADPRSVFRSEELPDILKNPKITTINGVDKYLFASRFEEFRAAEAGRGGGAFAKAAACPA